MKKIKVLNIMTSFLNYNGIGMSLLNYYNNINSNNIQMDYLVPNKVDEKLKQQFEKNNNKVIEFYLKNNKKMHQRNPFKYAQKLYKLIKEEKYDIVHAHGSSSMLCLQLLTAKFAGVKIRIAHSRNTESNFKLLNIILKPLFKKSYNVAFACGKEAGEFLFGKNEKFLIIPNGKESKKFSFKKEIRNKYRKENLLEGKIVLGHVGNFNYQKNHEFLIEILQELSKIKDNYFLILAGNGDKMPEIKTLIKKYGLEEKVMFLGQIPVDEVANWLNAMDIMLFPSRFEGFPNVLIEWQMNGLPCIISNKITKDVEITELVKFANINNVEQWVELIKKTNLEDREKYNKDIIEKIKKAGYDIKENACMMEKEYIKLYEKNT